MQDNIQRFVEKLQDTSSRIHPIYRRNFRELIKIIPLVGSWIDANTVGVVEDSILEERLSNLESACARALTLEDTEALIAEIANINSLILVIVVTNLGIIADQNRQIAANIGDILAIAEEQNGDPKPNARFRFVTLSGPSAVGKDCIIDLILHGASKAKVPIEALTKFTTRERRIVDSKYYDFISDEQFDLLERSGQLVFPYYKRGKRYGFDRTHLYNAARKEMVLFSVFTHFESLPADRQFLRNRSIHHIAVLLTADRQSLIMRSEARLLEPRDIEQRKQSIERDLTFLKENERYIHSGFDLIVENGDGHPKWETHDRIVQFVGLPELALMPQSIRSAVDRDHWAAG